MTDRESMQPEQRTGNCLLTGVCAAEGHRIQKAQREWQGLTDEEMEYAMPYAHSEFEKNEYREFASAIEAKLKEKNT